MSEHNYEQEPLRFPPRAVARGESEERECPTCGGRLVEYRHVLGRPLLAGLAALYRAGGRAHLGRVGLSYSQRCNFQKLRYWGLASRDPEKAGVWSLTERGVRFLHGELDLPRHVWTFRGQVLEDRQEGVERVDFRKANRDWAYLQREDYAAWARGHGIP